MLAVEQLRPGQTLVLPGHRRMTVETVEAFDADRLVVRWWHPAERGEPGYQIDGRYLGSLKPLRKGETVSVLR